MPKLKNTIRRPRSDFCLYHSEVILASEAKAKYGNHRGKVICPDCGREIKLRKPVMGGAHLTGVSRHLKNATKGAK